MIRPRFMIPLQFMVRLQSIAKNNILHIAPLRTVFDKLLNHFYFNFLIIYSKDNYLPCQSPRNSPTGK